MGFDVGKVKVGAGRTVIMAEAGVNHLGRMDYAEELIKTAARAGADIVKFQTYKAAKLTTPNAPRFWSWNGEVNGSGSQFDSYARLDSFEREQYIQLIEFCKKYKIEFMSTPFDFDAADMLFEIGMKAYKIASCDLNNFPFLKHIAAKRLPIFLSTGAAELDEIRNAVAVIEGEGNKKICIMHCTLCYPTEPKDANLSAIKDIQANFPNHVMGLSDHTLGTIVPAASVLYGVQAIEKHYTFDKTLPYSADHWLSLDEKELAKLVQDVRTLEQSIGGGHKVRLECEIPAFKFARRSVVAAQPIAMGVIITRDMLATKRPGTGLPPEFIERFVGAMAARNIEADALLNLEDIQAH